MCVRFIYFLVFCNFIFILSWEWTTPRSKQYFGNEAIGVPFKTKHAKLPNDIIFANNQSGPFLIPYKELKESSVWDHEAFNQIIQEGANLYSNCIHPLISKWINRRLKRAISSNEAEINISIDKFTEKLSLRDVSSTSSDLSSESISDDIKKNNVEEYIISIWDYFQVNYFKSLVPTSLDMEFYWSKSNLKTASSFPYCENDFYSFWDGDALTLPALIFHKNLFFEGKKCLKNIVKLSIFRCITELFYNLHWIDGKESQKNWEQFKILPEILSKCEKDKIFSTISKNFNIKSPRRAILKFVGRNNDVDLFPSLSVNPQTIIETKNLNLWDTSLEIPPNIDTSLGLTSMNLYNATYEEVAKGTEVIKYIVTMEVPIDEFSRALIKGDLASATNIITMGNEKLSLLKPVQLNFVQNGFIAACDSLLNPYYKITNPSDDSPVELDENDIRNVIIEAYNFLKDFFDNIRRLNGYPSLDSSFLSVTDNVAMKDESLIGCVRKMIDLTQAYTPVIFPKEYLNDLIAIDDTCALEYILNFYNFNMFGGRLPTSLNAKFIDLPGDETNLTSNDLDHSFLGPVTIYLSTRLLESKKLETFPKTDIKTIICKLLLDECVDIFKKSVNINPKHWSDNLIEVHINRLIEKSHDWPFHYDSCVPSLPCLEKDNIDDNENFITYLNHFKKIHFRQDINILWEKGQIPLRHINSLAHSGNFVILERILNSEEAISFFTKLDYKQLILAENLIKESIKANASIYDAELLAETISAVDVAFESIRIEWHIHNLISSKSLIQGLINNFNLHAQARLEGTSDNKLYPFGQFGQFVNLDTNEAQPLEHMEVLPYIDSLKAGDKKYLDQLERINVVEKLYKYYNEHIFMRALPSFDNSQKSIVKFSEIWKTGQLSDLKYNDKLEPVITIDENISEIKLLNDLLLSEMMKMHYMYKINRSLSVFSEILPKDYKLIFPPAYREVKRQFDEKFIRSFNYEESSHIALPNTIKSYRIQHFVNQILKARSDIKSKENTPRKDRDNALIDAANESSLYGFAHYLLDCTEAEAGSVDDNPISLIENMPNIEYFKQIFNELDLPFSVGQVDEQWGTRLTEEESERISRITDLNQNVIGLLVSAGFTIERILNLIYTYIPTSTTPPEINDTNVSENEEISSHKETDNNDDEDMLGKIMNEYEPLIVHYTGAIIDEILNNHTESAKKLIWSLESDTREKIISLSTRMIKSMRDKGSMSPEAADSALSNLMEILL